MNIPIIEDRLDNNLENQFFPLFQYAAVGFAKVGLDCSWLRVNRKLCEITGYSEEELLAGTFIDITHPDDIEADLSNMRQVMAGELDINVMEKRYIRKDGAIVWIQLNATLARDTQNRPDYFIVVIEDITQRKLAEAALAASERQYRKIVRTANEGILILDADNRVSFLNRKMADMLGDTITEKLGQSIDQLIDEESLEITKKRMWDRRAGLSEQFELKFTRKDGAPLWTIVSASPLFEEDGAYLGSLGMFTDITDRKQAEAELLGYQQKLEQSNKELEHFALIASHDLQAPLRKIDKFSNLLQKTAANTLSEESRDYLQRIRKSVHHMQHLVTGLLNLSRISRRGSPFTNVPLQEVLNRALEELSEHQQQGRIQVDVCYNGPTTIPGDEAQLQNALVSLLSNAYKFHAPGATPQVTISVDISDDQHCMITVADNGIGFRPESAEVIFETFQRLRPDYPGTGVGLSLVRKIVERHQGYIQALSVPNVGATFIITLPLQ